MEKEIYTCRFLTEIMPTPPKKPMSISYAARTGRCTAAGRTTLPPVWTRTNSGKGAKYTRGRGPVELAYSEMFGTQSEAMHREAEIKKLSRPQKQALLDRQTGGEMLTVYDAADRPCGARPRSIVHAQGLRHHVCHLWVVGVRDGVRGIWLQKRQNDRPLYPGFYDLTATGHMDPGETPLTAALREAREEIGLHADEADVTPGGSYRQRYYRADGGFDDELSFVFLMRRDGVPPVRARPRGRRDGIRAARGLCPRASRPSRPPCARHGRRSSHAAARKSSPACTARNGTACARSVERLLDDDHS